MLSSRVVCSLSNDVGLVLGQGKRKCLAALGVEDSVYFV